MNRSRKSKPTRNASKGKRRGAPKSMLERIKALSVGDAAEALYGAYSAAGALIGLNSEVKFVDTQIAPAFVTYAGVVTPLSLLAEGDTVSQRSGESIRAHGIELKWSVCFNTVATTFNVARMVLVQDSGSRGAAPAAADILETVGSGYGVLSPWNHLGAPRFNILWDSGPLSVATGGPEALSGSVVVPLKDHIRYSGAGGAIGQQYEGGIFLLQIGDQVTNGPNMYAVSRLHYVDN